MSIPYVGKTIRVLNMNLAEAPPSVLPLEEFGVLLSICAASLDVEAVEPWVPAQRRIKTNFLHDDTNFKKARHAFGCLNMVCNHVAGPLKVAAAADDDLEP